MSLFLCHLSPVTCHLSPDKQTHIWFQVLIKGKKLPPRKWGAPKSWNCPADVLLTSIMDKTASRTVRSTMVLQTWIFYPSCGADQLGNPTSLLPLAVPKAVSSLKKAKWIRPTQTNIAGPGAPIVGVLNIFEYIFWILILCLMTLCISIIDIYRTIKFFTLTVIIISWIGHLWHITFLEKSWAIILETSCTICAPNVKISYHPLSLITALKWINYCFMEILWTPKHTFSSQGFLRGWGGGGGGVWFTKKKEFLWQVWV